MRKGLRRVAGAPNGNYGDWDGLAGDSSFNCPLDLVASADGDMIYIADCGNASIRVLDLTTNYVATVGRATWITPEFRPRHLSLSPDGTKLLVTGTAMYVSGSVIAEFHIATGTFDILATPPDVGAIAYCPEDDGTAIVRARIQSTATGWHSLALTGPERGTLTEPPAIPDPPYCDPPTNSIPVTVVHARDSDYAPDAGVAYVGSVVVAYRTFPDSPSGALTAFDPWGSGSATPTFPSPYTTCATPDEPAATVVPIPDEVAPPALPLQICTRGTEGPPVLLAPVTTGNAIVQVITVDVTNPENPFTIEFDDSGVFGKNVVGIAYSAARDRLFFSTTADPENWNVQSDGCNQIVELTDIQDPPIHWGGAGVVRGSPRRVVTVEEPLGIVDEDGNILADEDGNALIFG